MQLKKYLKIKKLTQFAFAKKIGVIRSSLANYVVEKSILPSPFVQKKIHDATNGAVSYVDWADPRSDNDIIKIRQLIKDKKIRLKHLSKYVFNGLSEARISQKLKSKELTDDELLAIYNYANNYNSVNSNPVPRPINSRGFIKMHRNKALLDELLLAHNHNALILLIIISQRCSINNEALLGDFENYGLTEAEYRSAKKKLQKLGYCTFTANKLGTIAKLIKLDLISP